MEARLIQATSAEVIDNGNNLPVVMSNLLETNNFQEMFALVSERNKQIQEHTLFMKKFFKLLNLDSIKDLIAQEKMLDFLDALIPFFNADERLSKKEKKDFLNGCENILFLQSILHGRYDYAEYLNEFRLEKNLHINRDFLLNAIKYKNIAVIEKLIGFSENIKFDNSKLLKFLYVNDIKDYSLYQELISKHGLDINGYGSLELNYKVDGTFAHLVAMSSTEIDNEFFTRFVKDYGSRINFNSVMKNEATNEELNFIEIIINNTSLETKDKLGKLATVLNYGGLSEKNIENLTNILISEEVIGLYYDSSVYDSLFSHQCFNSTIYDREELLNKILKLDNCITFDNIRKKYNDTVNPTSILLDKFFKSSSPVIDKKEHPFIYWLRLNGLKSSYSVNTLYSLIKHYRHELNDIGVYELNVNQEIIEILKQNGLKDLVKVEIKTTILDTILDWIKPTKEEKESVSKDLVVVEKIEKKKELKVSKPNSILPTFNDDLYRQIKDKEIIKYIESIKMSAKQFEIVYEDKKHTQDYRYIKTLLPNFLNKSAENYLNNFSKNEQEAKRNILIQLRLLNKKTFELLTKGLEYIKDDEKIQKELSGVVQVQSLTSYQQK